MSTQDITKNERTLTYESLILSWVLNKTTFLWALCLASIIPFVLGRFQFSNIIGFTTILAGIAFCAAIHIPLTLYLFSDKKIRSQATARPFVLIGVPCFLISLSIYMFVQFHPDTGSRTPQYLFYFMFAMVSWQHWHFGKQNVGIFAFARLATNSGPMRKVERNLIVAGSICGVLVTYSMVGPDYIELYSPTAELGTFEYIMGSVIGIAKYFQYAITVISLTYVILNWRSLTLATSLLLLIGSNFFFLDYLIKDFPPTLEFFGPWVFAHGLQYTVFLFYHSFGLAENEVQKPALSDMQKVERLKVIGRICVGPAIFAFAVLIAAEFYAWGYFLSFNKTIFGILNWTLGLDLSGLTVQGVVNGVIIGILMTHFWLDGFFWRLRDKAPREWARSRYYFLFQI